MRDFSYRQETLAGRRLFRDGENYLMLIKVSLCVARLTGATSEGDERPLPDGFTIVATFGYPVPPKPINGAFILLWSDSYVVLFNGMRVLSLENPRRQTLKLHGYTQDVSPILSGPGPSPLNRAPEASFVDGADVGDDE